MRWLVRIADRVDLDTQSDLPDGRLLDHVPLLLLGIADYIEDPGTTRARRHAGDRQGDGARRAAPHAGLRRAPAAQGIRDPRRHPLSVPRRRRRRIERVHARASWCSAPTGCSRRSRSSSRRRRRSSSCSRGAGRRARGATARLQPHAHARAPQPYRRGDRRVRRCMEMPEIAERSGSALDGVVVRNVESMRVVLDNLLELTRPSSDSRQQRHVLLPGAAAEVVRQLRELRARARRERAHRRRSARRRGERGGGGALPNEPPLQRDQVRGPGRRRSGGSRSRRRIEPAPTARRRGRRRGGGQRRRRARRSSATQLFQRFFRAHEHSATGVEGTGLGLSIVRETVGALGGRAWAEFPDGSSVFAFSLPVRRAHRFAPERRRTRVELAARAAPAPRLRRASASGVSTSTGASGDAEQFERVAERVEHRARADVALEAPSAGKSTRRTARDARGRRRSSGCTARAPPSRHRATSRPTTRATARADRRAR